MNLCLLSVVAGLVCLSLPYGFQQSFFIIWECVYCSCYLLLNKCQRYFVDVFITSQCYLVCMCHVCCRYGLYNISFSHLENTVELLPEEEVNATGIFLLEKNTGVLRTNAPLTRYTHGIFTAFVTASSSPLNTPSDEPAVSKVMVSLVFVCIYTFTYT